MNEARRSVSLTDCDREPIHVPGSIQSHGSLLVLDDSMQVVAWSEDFDAAIAATGVRPAALSDLLPVEDLARLTPQIEAGEARPIRPIPLEGSSRKALVHRNAQGWTLVELEDLELDYEDLAGVLRRTQETTQRLGRIDDSDELCHALATSIRQLTGFERVMVYRFAADWHGWVVAEDRADDVDSYLGFHFPASDIPAQARALYERNPVRLIADVGAAARGLRFDAKGPAAHDLDLSDAVLRSVSPIHLQYLENMGVGSSMSISLLRDGRLWALVACHDRGPRRVPFEIRQACELLSQFVSVQIERQDELEATRDLARGRATLQALAERLVPDARGGIALHDHVDTLRRLAANDALVIATPTRTEVMGATAEAAALRTWLDALPAPQGDETWSTDELAPDAPFHPKMAGALVVRTTGDAPICVVWLRRERIRTTRWAGDPNKPIGSEDEGTARLNPRESFAAWVEETRGRSAPWTVYELEAARELKTLILSPSVRTSFALQDQAVRLEQLNARLTASNEELSRFAYVASHDLRAPLRAAENIVQWLREDEADNLSEQGREFLDLLASRVHRMDQMMIDLLAYARAGREESPIETIDLDELVTDIAESLARPVGLEVVAEDLGVVRGPRVPIFQIVLNLVSNAIKHHDRDRGTVRVRVLHLDPALEIIVEDDGPGIDPEHRERVFEMFTTLASRDDVEGSGIGLALVRRYAMGRGGNVWIEDNEPRGTRFVVRLIPEAGDE